MRYRVDQLAARGGVSVDTVRFYQAKGLLPPPEREGRIAWYGGGHLDRLQRIRDLQAKGFTLASIKRLLEGELDPADEALVAALGGPGAGPEELGELVTRSELAGRTGVSPALLEALERQGLLTPVRGGDEPLYTGADTASVAAGLSLLEAGLPLSELLALAREHDEAMRAIAHRAVDLFVRFVRDRIRSEAATEAEAGEQLVGAFRRMLPATATLVANHFQRVLVAAAQARLERDSGEEAPR